MGYIFFIIFLYLAETELLLPLVHFLPKDMTPIISNFPSRLLVTRGPPESP